MPLTAIPSHEEGTGRNLDPSIHRIRNPLFCCEKEFATPGNNLSVELRHQACILFHVNIFNYLYNIRLAISMDGRGKWDEPKRKRLKLSLLVGLPYVLPGYLTFIRLLCKVVKAYGSYRESDTSHR